MPAGLPAREDERSGEGRGCSPSAYSSFQLTDSDFSTTSITLWGSRGQLLEQCCGEVKYLGEWGGRGEGQVSRPGLPGGAERGR